MPASPRRPSSTTRIFSSAENCRRVARRMSLTIRSAGALTGARVSVSSSLLMATMIQKSSVPEYPRSVPQALTADKSNLPFEVQRDRAAAKAALAEKDFVKARMHLEAAAKSTRQTAGYALEEYAIEWIAHMSWPYSGCEDVRGAKGRALRRGLSAA